jgi:diaminopimelate epimerase
VGLQPRVSPPIVDGAVALAIGADGVILIEPSRKADFRWDFYNADGSRAEMCGNGGRCAARSSLTRSVLGSGVSIRNWMQGIGKKPPCRTEMRFRKLQQGGPFPLMPRKTVFRNFPSALSADRAIPEGSRRLSIGTERTG